MIKFNCPECGNPMNSLMQECEECGFPVECLQLEEDINELQNKNAEIERLKNSAEKQKISAAKKIAELENEILRLQNEAISLKKQQIVENKNSKQLEKKEIEEWILVQQEDVPEIVEEYIAVPVNKEVDTAQQFKENEKLQKRSSRSILKYVPIFVIIPLIIGLGITLSSNDVKELNQGINRLGTSEEITQAEIDYLFAMYAELAEDKKAQIENYDILKAYENVDITKVNEIKIQISSLNGASTFGDLLKIKEFYDSMTRNEKALVDISSVEAKMQLTDLEKAAVAAIQYIGKGLKNGSSLEIESASGIDDLDGTTKYYLISIGYSATNSFGGRKDATSFQTISDEFENPWFGLALLTGKYEEALKCTSWMQYYLLHDEEPVEFDIEKLNYYKNTEINN